jgi:acetyl esterase/lipase
MARTHPPFDPELTAVLTLVHEHLSPTITARTSRNCGADMVAATEADLPRNGTVELRNLPSPARQVHQRSRCSSAGPAAGAPVFCYMHGGGMIIGNSRTGVATVLDWAVPTTAAGPEPIPHQRSRHRSSR